MTIKCGFINKVIPAVVIVMSASVVQAQPNDMAVMMQNLQDMQRCMASIDQTELKQLEQRARGMEAEIKKLCAQGNESKAQQQALTFALEIRDSKLLQQMKKCTEKMADFAKNMPNPLAVYDSFSDENEAKGICQSL
ncbi:hypothetical protein [Oceanicoccus sp. KOV_DT_Chl]|uniref:hypothetical protein n=1 Tax=Oceanicoccus sp. KOV_DT_Chl TaxID=1904639 RepID=UPI000C7B5D21|nr:hypothetical protein [Oceanicoccus sp. KOV_DT_Chl]